MAKYHRVGAKKVTMVIATVALFCMVAAQDEDEDQGPLFCPDEEMVVSSRHSKSAKKKVSLEFINGAGIELSLYWVDFDGVEVPVNLYARHVYIGLCIRLTVWFNT